jgi:hypothetical protein
VQVLHCLTKLFLIKQIMCTKNLLIKILDNLKVIPSLPSEILLLEKMLKCDTRTEYLLLESMV